MNNVYQSEEPSESHHDSQKDLEMVQQQLSNIMANAEQLMEQCGCGSPRMTEAWVQSKMTLANDYLESVHAYVVNGGPMKSDAGQAKPNKVDFVIAVEKAMTDGSSKA